MLIKVSQTDFYNTLQAAQRGTSSQSTLPVLTGIKIKTDKKDGLILHSTDLELSVQVCCPAVVEKAGTVVVSGRLIVEIFRHLSEGAIELSTIDDDKSLAIKTDSSVFKVKTMPPEDFPEFPKVQEKKAFTIESKTFSEMIKQTIKAVSRDETRPALTGALLSGEEKGLLMVATDSYRLAVKTTERKKSKEDFSVLIPLRALEEIQKTISGLRNDISMVCDESLLMLKTDKTVIVTRLLEGQFPNYKQLIPKESTLTAKLNKEELIKAISRVALLAQKNMSIKLIIEDQAIKLIAATQGVGEAQEEIKAKVSGEKVGEMAFNAQYLMEGLQGADGEEISLEFTGAVNPGVIRSANKNDYLYLIMPIRLS